MRVVVTGGAGFIGSRICQAHIERGDEVLSIDDMSNAVRGGPPLGADYEVVDVTDFDFVRDAIVSFSPDVVSHHAALVSVRESAVIPGRYASVNVAGTVNVLRACLELLTLPTVIFASSGGTVYGEPDVLPVPEDAFRSPLSVYGMSKVTAEAFVDFFGRRCGLPSVTLRYGNVYGRGQRSDLDFGVVSIFVDRMLRNETPRIFGDGSKTRDYVHVDDVVSANLMAIDRGWNGVYNIGTGTRTSDLELFGMISERCGFDRGPEFVEDGPNEVQHVVLDCTKARSAGWVPSMDLPSGIDDTIVRATRGPR